MLHSTIMTFSFSTLVSGDDLMVGSLIFGFPPLVFRFDVDMHRPSMGDLFSFGGVRRACGSCPFRGAMMATCAIASCFLRL